MPPCIISLPRSCQWLFLNALFFVVEQRILFLFSPSTLSPHNQTWLMRLLILGGTIFLGRHIVEAALAEGHEVTLFNRGLHFPDLFPDVEKLRGEREGDLAPLRGGRWDAVIDTSGHIPRDVRATARLLADATDHYTFISSINVYPDCSIIGIDESTPIARIEGDEPTEMTFENYGALKGMCEAEAEQAMPGRATSIRAGLIVGPQDFSDRFSYWPSRLSRGGSVLAPGRPERPVQIIDVRDLAWWALRTATDRIGGVYNATGPDRILTMREVIETCASIGGTASDIVWVDDDFLVENDVGAWVDLPLWLPEGSGLDGLCRINIDRAVAAGLRFRPLEETVAATLEWTRLLPADRTPRAGISPQREEELLHRWMEH